MARNFPKGTRSTGEFAARKGFKKRRGRLAVIIFVEPKRVRA